MPRTSVRTRRRRNPDPQTLREYRATAFAEALAQTGRFAVEQSEVFGGQKLIVSLHDLKVRLGLGGDTTGFPALGASKVWKADVWWSEPDEMRSLKVSREGRDLFAHVNEAAEQLGEIILWTSSVPEETLIQPDKNYRAYAFLPGSVKNRLTAAQVTLKSINDDLSRRSVAAASAKVSKVLAEIQSRHVPREYRKQVTELFRQAFAQEDLATYLQARELAELVSE